VGGSSGSGGGSGGAGGSSGGTGGRDAGNAPVDGGGSVDAEASDALDAPLLNNDGPASDETGASSDGAVLIQLDTGAQDSEGVDSAAIDTTVVFFDAEAETSMVDAAAPDMAATVDAGTCLQQIVNAGYSSGAIAPCSSCHDNSIDLTTECQDMITCLLTAAPSSAPCTGSESCHTTCLNSVGGSAVVDTCVTNLVNDACK
jgi:hypothetical protein